MNKPRAHRPCADEASMPVPSPLRTTLYDLIAAMQESAASPEDLELVTVAALHVLNVHHVTCKGRFKGYRMVGADDPASRGERA